MESIANSQPLNCLICSASVTPYCTAEVLGKYNVQYFQCSHCYFIFTEFPYWLEEAYNSAITKLDIGLISRNESMTPIVKTVINRWFNPNGRFVDYGGGYGMLVRMMRDRGFDYFRQDIHCANLYAESFDVEDISPFKAELLTAFEVFEHLTNPVAELEKMLGLSDSILFSTKILPNVNVTPGSWWYFTPETGQHIALYSRESLQILADRFNLHYVWSKQDIHLFSHRKINNSLFKLLNNPTFGRFYNAFVGGRPTLIDKDFISVKNRLKTLLLQSSGTV